MKLVIKIAFIWFSVAGGLAAVCGQTSAPPNIAASTSSNASMMKIAKIEIAPVIDGVLATDEWKLAAKAELNFQASPNQDDTPALEKTEAFITYDREHLYVAFHCFDSDPAAIRAPVSKRDNIDADDYVTVFLDTYDDKQRAYYLSASAAGVEQDGIYTESGGADIKWDGIYDVRAARTANGYAVEMAIPFKTMRFKAGKDRLGTAFSPLDRPQIRARIVDEIVALEFQPARTGGRINGSRRRIQRQHD